MKGMILFVTFSSLIMLVISLIITIAKPQWRIWPPPSRASWQYWYTWGLFSLAMVGIVILTILNWNTFVFPHWLRIVGALLAVGGISFELWAVWELGLRETQGLGGKFATTGPYRYSRNPQYVGAITLLLGFALLCNSVVTFAAVALVIFWYSLAPFAEEPWLRKHFGASYEEYCQHVPRFIGHSFLTRKST